MMVENTEDSRDFGARLLDRARELQETGLEWSQAHGVAWLEERIRQWPEKWGENLQILIYGDFEPLTASLKISSLGIVVHPEKLENTVARTARCVHKAVVKVNGKSVPGIIDAVRRINVLLGAYMLVEWGSGVCGWWSWVTHGSGAGVGTKLDHEDLSMAIIGIEKLPAKVRQKVDAALYWIREPKNTLMEFYRSDILRVYSSYWNAFECLIEAVSIVRPRPKLSKVEKQNLINKSVGDNLKELTPQMIDECYNKVLNPGFVAKARYALTVCFDKEADSHINECFELVEKHNRLYEIRNAINHGSIDAENPQELIRIESRFTRLRMVVLRMFGKLILFPAPAGSRIKTTPSVKK